jgi:predicted ATPase/DNA-binding SARP family transcriptional activator
MGEEGTVTLMTPPETIFSALTISLFGPMQVLVQGQPLPHLRSRQSLWLLALLTLRHDRPVEREWLAGTLWPDSDQSRGLRNLRIVLSELRKALGSESQRLQSPDRHTLSLDLAGAPVDVRTFDAAILSQKRSALTQAVTLYRGPLLEGCAEEWVFQERNVREQNCLHALQTLADSALAAGDYETAIGYYQRAVSIDPLWDSTRRGWMEALARSGDRNAAMQVYREFAELLKSDSLATPDEQTSALYARLRAEVRQQSSAYVVVAGKASPLPTVTGYLPHSLTDLVGREDERVEVTARLRRSRLVTLTGLGGIGKTRLALAVAAESVQEYADGVWLVALESIAEGSVLVPQIASVLGVREEPGRPLLQRLIDYLGKKRLLLVIDNCEHLLEASAQVIGYLLRECEGVRILATSREALGILGETAWAVPALAVPDPGQLPQDHPTVLRALMDYESVQLFVERAQAVQKTFNLTGSNALAVAQICSRMEGIPLALELAAARVKAMTVEQIAARLDNELGLLTGGSRAALARQQTLRATLDWSYALLTKTEQHLLRRLSVFAGGWSLEAAEQVGAGEGIETWQVVNLLTSLVDKSLVAFEERNAGGRYRLLELVRQYAAESLLASDEAALVKAGHRDYFLALAEEAEPQLQGAEQGVWLARLETEHKNLRVALAWSEAEAQGAEVGLRLTGALWRFWDMHGYYSEGRACLAEALEREGAGRRTKERAKALNGAGVLAYYEGDYVAARALHEESVAISRELGDKRGIAWPLHHLGNVTGAQGEYDTARRLYEESLAIFRDLRNKQGIAWTLHHLGEVVGAQGSYGTAEALQKESMAIQQELKNKLGIGWSLNSLGRIAYEQGNSASARTLYAESISLHRELGDRRGVAKSLEGLAAVLLAQTEVQKAVRLWGTAYVLRASIGSPLPPNEREKHDQQVEQARLILGEDAFAAAWKEGLTLPWEQAVVYALENRRPLS